MVKRKSSFSKGWWYGCPNFPRCRITAALHPDGTLMSTPADETVKILRIQCHALCEKIWGKWKDPFTDKVAMYEWMKHNTRTGHIGLLRKEELFDLLKRLRRKISKNYAKD